MFAHKDISHDTQQFLKWFSDCLYFCLLYGEQIARPTVYKSAPAVVVWNIVHII